MINSFLCVWSKYMCVIINYLKSFIFFFCFQDADEKEEFDTVLLTLNTSTSIIINDLCLNTSLNRTFLFSDQHCSHDSDQRWEIRCSIWWRRRKERVIRFFSLLLWGFYVFYVLSSSLLWYFSIFSAWRNIAWSMKMKCFLMKWTHLEILTLVSGSKGIIEKNWHSLKLKESKPSPIQSKLRFVYD